MGSLLRRRGAAATLSRGPAVEEHRQGTATTRSTPVTLFRSGDARVIDLGSTLRFESRAVTQTGLGLGAILIGFVFWASSRGWPSMSTLVSYSLATWAAWILWLCGGLLITVGTARAIAPP